MSAASTLQFMQTGFNSSCGPTARPIAGHPARPIAGNGFPPEGWVEAVSTKPIVRVAPPATERKVLLASQRAAQFGIAGDAVGSPHYRYPPGRARAPWLDTYGGGGRKIGLGVIDAIKHRRSGYAGTIIKTRRGTVVQTHSGVAGKSRADVIRLASTGRKKHRVYVRFGQMATQRGHRPLCPPPNYPCGTMSDGSVMCCAG